MLVVKCTKLNANFTPLNKMSKLQFLNQFIVLYREINKRLQKRFFQTIKLDYDRRKGFLRL